MADGWTVRPVGVVRSDGLHTVTVTAMDGPVLTVDGLEALDGTPVLDVKIALGPVEQR